MKNKTSSGNQFEFLAKSSTKSGDPVIMNKIVGVAIDDVALGSLGLAECSGVFSLDKAKDLAVEFGQEVYINIQNKTVGTTLSDKDIFIGHCWKSTSKDESKIDVKLN